MLKLSPEAWSLISAEAERLYPMECCGLLLGRDEDSARRAERAVAAPNVHSDGGARHFQISPDAFLRAEREAETDGFDVVGIYHSHPDVAARPSRFDLEAAWPWYSYLIVAVGNGRVAEVRCWRLSDDRERFNDEPVCWLDERGENVHPSLDTHAAALLRRPSGEC